MYLADHTRVTAQSFGRAATSAPSTSRGSQRRSEGASTIPPPAKVVRFQTMAPMGPPVGGAGLHNLCEGSSTVGATHPSSSELSFKIREVAGTTVGSNDDGEPPR